MSDPATAPTNSTRSEMPRCSERISREFKSGPVPAMAKVTLTAVDEDASTFFVGVETATSLTGDSDVDDSRALAA